MTKIALAYGRQSVSRSRDDRDGGSISIAYQREAAEQWAGRNDARIVGWHQDVDESGASTTRAGMDAFLAEAKSIRPDVALFWDVKRLSRNLKYFLTVFDVLDEIGCELVSCTEGTRHPPLVWKMLALFAEEERDRIATNITHGKRESAKRGRHLGYAPIGYCLSPTSELVIDPETQWVVEWMFARALEGNNPTAICRLANAQAIPTPRRETQWSRQTVTHILTRPTYAGLVEAGARSRSRYGKSLPVVRALGTHEAIIPRDQWDAVQAAIAGASKPAPRRGAPHWLAGRVSCHACGSRLYYVDAGRTTNPEWRDRYWRCAATYKVTFGRDRGVVCTGERKRIAESVLSAMVRSSLVAALERRWTIEDVIDRMDAEHASTARTMRHDLDRELAELQRQRTRITDAIQFGVGDIASLAQRDRELIARMTVVSGSLAEVPPEPDRLAIARAIEVSDGIAETLRYADPDHLGLIAVELGLSVVVDMDTPTCRLAYRATYGWLAG